jgi:hypothetical protein
MKKNMISTSSSTVEAWSSIGVATRDANGELRDSSTVFYEALEGLSKIENDTERDTLAMTLFGKSADSLAGIVDDGGAALKELGDQAESLGLILSQDALDSANAFNDVIDTMKAKASGSFTKIGNAAATSFLPVMEKLSPVVEKLADGAALAIVKVASFASQVLSTIKTVKLFASAVGAIVAANPVVLGIAAAVAAGALLIANWDKVKAYGSALCSAISNEFTGAKDAVVGAFTSIKSTVSGVFTWIGNKLSWLDEKISSVPVIGSIYSGLKGGVSSLVSGASSLLSGASGSVEDRANSVASTYVSGHATGTSFFSGGLTRVNERGGEIINLPSGSKIIPHDVSTAAVGGNTITVYVTVQGNVIDDGDYADRLGNTIAQRILAALENV